MIEYSKPEDLEYKTRITRGNITVDVFDPCYLTLNTHPNPSITLSEHIYSESTLSLTFASIELLKEENTVPHLHGLIQFETPTQLQRGANTDSMMLKRLFLHLSNILADEGKIIQLDANSLTVISPFNDPVEIVVSLNDYDCAHIELGSILPEDSSDTLKYNQIIFLTELWAELQDYLNTFSTKPTSQHTIYVGNTGSHTLSSIELAIEQHLGMYNSGEALAKWGSDIDGYALDMLERSLTDQNSTQAIAHEVVQQSRLSKEGRSITQGDIIKALSKVLADSRRTVDNTPRSPESSR